MYYGECTPAYAVEVINEIIENAAGPMQTLAIIKNFMNNNLSTDDVVELISE